MKQFTKVIASEDESIKSNSRVKRRPRKKLNTYYTPMPRKRKISIHQISFLVNVNVFGISHKINETLNDLPADKSQRKQKRIEEISEMK